MADDLTYIGNLGDANPLEYRGLFLFKRDDGDYFALVIDNIHDSVGPSDVDGSTDESVWIEDFWIDTQDLLEAKEELLNNSGVNWDSVYQTNPEAMEQEELEILLAQLAVEQRHGASGRSGDTELYHSFLEAAERVLETAPHDEKLRDELQDYLDSELQDYLDNY